jgi:hypothetical protein
MYLNYYFYIVVAYFGLVLKAFGASYNKNLILRNVVYINKLYTHFFKKKCILKKNNMIMLKKNFLIFNKLLINC